MLEVRITPVVLAFAFLSALFSLREKKFPADTFKQATKKEKDLVETAIAVFLSM